MTRIPLPNPMIDGCPSPTDDLPGFLAWHRARFGDARMDDGDDDGDGDDDPDGDDDGDDEGDDDPDGDDDGDDDLTRTQKALKRERELRRKERKARRDAERKLAERDKPKPKPKPQPKGGGKSDDDGDDTPTVEELREQARRDAFAEVRLERAGDRVVALAADLLADPGDARAFLDLDDLADDTGAVDEDEVREALDELLEKKPHLRKSGRRRFGGGADGGANRGGGGDGGGKRPEPQPGLGRLRAGYEQSSKTKRKARTGT